MNLKRLSLVLFYLLVFLIPCNLAKHWPQNFSYVSGILVDYLIPTLYLTDILILVLFGLWLISEPPKIPIRNRFPQDDPGRKTLWIKWIKWIKSPAIRKNLNLLSVTLLGIIIFCITNIFLAKNRPAAALKWLKLGEMGFLVFWIKTQLKSTNTLELLIKVLSLSVIWQSILAIIQWLKQGSIIGYLNFGEQPYSSATFGVKKITFLGQVKVLPMGTFPHPNVLAGFLVVSLMIILSTGINKPKSFITKLALVLGILVLGLTFSFPCWLAFLIFAIWYVKAGPLHRSKITGVFVKARPLHWRFLLTVLIASLTVVLTFVYGLNTLEPTSFLIRIKLMEIAFKMWLSSPLMGVGLNNFIVRLEEFGTIPLNYRFLQPVHNIFLLVLSETGVVGLIGFILIILKNLELRIMNYESKFRIKNEKFLITPPAGGYLLLITVLFLGLFDHYWLTIQQGSLILSLVLGLSLRTHTTAGKM